MTTLLKKFTFLLLIFSIFSIQASFAKNQLYNDPSPYLAMHGNDPVNWMKWGKAALDKAKKEHKLIFISSGYYACHWCHVMHRESYSNPEIAKLLNDHYIAIKIDRELNPVLDKRLINFVQATAGSAGWPLNVFLTPDGYPLVGTTYIPKAEFAIALSRLQKQWQDNPEQLSQDAKSMNQKLAASLLSTDKHGSKKTITQNTPDFIQQALQQANKLQGGFSQVRQFPSAVQMLVLLKLNQTIKNEELDEFLQLTLDNMQNKGLHDEIAGGFYRYTVDPDWQRPHFEKMLYTNALLPLVYQQAAKQYNKPEYQATAIETLHFLLNDMQANNGAFIASLSAVDDKDVEGGYYLWTEKELKSILNPQELTLANTAWGLNKNADNFEAGNMATLQMPIPQLAKKLNKDSHSLRVDLKQLKNKLNNYRKKHRKIPKDDKLLAGWNGLALTAFANLQTSDKTLKPAGQKLAKFLMSLWNGKQLNRSYNNKQAASLFDYAAVAWGLAHWGKATQDEQALTTAKQIIDTAWQVFYSKNGWRESATSLLPQPLVRQHIEDSSVPSGEALLIAATQLLDVKKWDKTVKQVLNHSTQDIELSPFSYASLIAVSQQPPIGL